MHHASPSIQVLLIGYPDDVSHMIASALESDMITTNSVPSCDHKISHHFPIVDCILIGENVRNELSHLIGECRSIWPYAIILACPVLHETPLTLLPYIDGFFRIETTSHAWKENLTALIITSVNRRREEQKKKPDEYHISGKNMYERIFFENVIPMCITFADNGEFIEVNYAFVQLLGHQPEEIIGKTSLELNIYKDPEDRRVLLSELDEQSPLREKEVIIRKKDGTCITCLLSVVLMKWGNKKVLLTSLHDISYLKEIERTLSARNQCIQEILSSVSEGIVVYDTKLRYRVWNRFMEQLTGISEEEVLGKPALFFRPHVEEDDILSLLKKALEGTESLSRDVWYQVPQTGKSGWISIITAPFRDSKGKIIGAIASVRDIGERKKAEDEIRSHKGLLRSIIDTVPVSIICFDDDGRILLANTSFSSSFHLKPEAIEGHSYEEFCTDTRFESHKQLITRALSGREVPFNEEIEQEGHHPRKRFLRGRYSPLRGTDGTIHGVVSVIIDVTDLKSAQAMIEHANAKLNLLSSITRHDILNSLTAVLGYLTYAEEENDTGKIKQYIQKSHQVASLIREQIEFTRDYQDLGVKEPIWQNAQEVFQSAISSLKLGDVHVHLSLDDLYVFADPLLERVIYNLVDNALRYAEKLSKISSSWYQNGDIAIWLIRDDGIGIPASMKERIFRKGVGKNTGLGLFLTREILDITGISIAETGTEGEGAVFEIRIPSDAWRQKKLS